jgi:hypothetical protein
VDGFGDVERGGVAGVEGVVAETSLVLVLTALAALEEDDSCNDYGERACGMVR